MLRYLTGGTAGITSGVTGVIIEMCYGSCGKADVALCIAIVGVNVLGGTIIITVIAVIIAGIGIGMFLRC